MTRRASSGRDTRKTAAAPYGRKQPAAGSTGLTSYMGASNLGFEDEEADEVPELKPQAKAHRGLASKALGAISFRKGKAAGSSSSASTAPPPVPITVEVFKPSENDVMGITFEMPQFADQKGVVVAQIHDGYLMAKAKTLLKDDLVHTINGVAVHTPQDCADQLKVACGTITLTLTRGTHSDAADGGHKAGGGGFFGSSLSFRPGGHKAHGPASSSGGGGGGGGASDDGRRASAAAASAPPAGETSGGGEDANTTVVVSCSQLIVESKKIMGPAAGLDERLDSLFAQLKAKEVPSKEALKTLIDLVGQTTVEQAGLVIANTAKGLLAEGWVEYLDKGSNKYYYYNVHTKATTWTKPLKSRPPPAPPPRASATGQQAQAQAQAQAAAGEEEVAAATGDGGGGADAAPEAMDIADGDTPADGAAAAAVPPLVGAAGGDGTEADAERGRGGGPVRHGVADAIAARATRQKMVETVQIECSLTPRHAPPAPSPRRHVPPGLQTVSL